jgi:uncharacterized SAM-binding protein YcdF (DUF218 family)
MYLKKLILIIPSLVCVYVFIILLSIYSYSFKSSAVEADAAIVLGAAVWDSKPSPVFEQRIKHSIILYNSSRVKKLIFTGGIGIDDNQSEAQIAKEYALKNGVASRHIVVEDKSKFTIENLKFTALILSANDISLVLIVSDPLHMKRAMTMALDLGINALPSPTKTSRYQSLQAKTKMLLSETYYYIGYKISRFLPI